MTRSIKDLMLQYAAYNVWAHQKLADVILLMPEEKTAAGAVSSFDGIKATLLHMLDAESIWWQRMKLSERIIRPSENFKGSTKDTITALINQSKQWEEWIQNATELAIEHVFQYQNSKKEILKQPIYQMLLHVFNHATYHRGQLITLLRQAGVTKLPSTDFAAWSISKKII